MKNTTFWLCVFADKDSNLFHCSFCKYYTHSRKKMEKHLIQYHQKEVQEKENENN